MNVVGGGKLIKIVRLFLIAAWPERIQFGTNIYVAIFLREYSGLYH